jgi:hypothetical protein
MKRIIYIINFYLAVRLAHIRAVWFNIVCCFWFNVYLLVNLMADREDVVSVETLFLILFPSYH